MSLAGRAKPMGARSPPFGTPFAGSPKRGKEKRSAFFLFGSPCPSQFRAIKANDTPRNSRKVNNGLFQNLQRKATTTYRTWTGAKGRFNQRTRERPKKGGAKTISAGRIRSDRSDLEGRRGRGAGAKRNKREKMSCGVAFPPHVRKRGKKRGGLGQPYVHLRE